MKYTLLIAILTCGVEFIFCIPVSACELPHIAHQGKVEVDHVVWSSVLDCDVPTQQEDSRIMLRHVPKGASFHVSSPFVVVADSSGQVTGFEVAADWDGRLHYETITPDITPPLLDVDSVQRVSVQGAGLDTGALVEHNVWIKQVRDVRQRDVTLAEREVSREFYSGLVLLDDAVTLHVRANDLYDEAGGIASIVSRRQDVPVHRRWWVWALVSSLALMSYGGARALRHITQEEDVNYFLDTYRRSNHE